MSSRVSSGSGPGVVVLAALACLASCSSAPGLRVDLKTDFVPDVEFDAVALVLDGAPAVTTSAMRGADYVRGVPVLDVGIAPGRHELEARLTLRGTTVIARRYVWRLDASAIRSVILTRSCAGVACPGAGDTADATECLGGVCVSPECVTLGADGCHAPTCTLDADCATTTSCVVPRCVEGVCIESSDPTSCGSGRYCQPGAGCLPLPGDAGPIDGGVPGDAMLDAGCRVDGDCDDHLSCTHDACASGTCTHTSDDALCTTGVSPHCDPSSSAADPATGCVAAACDRTNCVAGPCETAVCAAGSCVRAPTCADTETCCSGVCATSCSAVPCAGQSAGTVCRAAVGACDVAETCDGISPTCPPDALALPSAVCRASRGECDLAESCTGTSSDCPTDAFVTVGTSCAGGSCDATGTCSAGCTPGGTCSTGNPCELGTVSCATGTPACRATGPASAGTMCRASAGPCDVAETCTGSSTICPADAFLPSSVTCRAAVGACDAAETCTGISAACPGDALLGAGTPCRASAGACDVGESCTGADASCPANTFASSGTVCRPSAGVCDVAESCTGTGPSCPGDAFASSALVCRAAAGPCDVAEACTGSSGACPSDGFATGAICRASAGPCDVAEACTGASASCPGDGFASSGVCRVASGACDVPESCNGSGAACPPDGFAGAGTVCRPGTGHCNTSESCTGGSASCPPDGFTWVSDYYCDNPELSTPLRGYDAAALASLGASTSISPALNADCLSHCDGLAVARCCYVYYDPGTPSATCYYSLTSTISPNPSPFVGRSAGVCQ